MEIVYYGILWYVVFLVSLVIHEFAHAFVSMKLGDPTAYHNGQVTFNPIPHIKQEVFGTTIIPIVSYVFGGWMFGWGSAPYDYYWAYNHPKKAAKMAMAGPLSNLFLVVLSMIVIRIGMATGIFDVPDSITFTHVVGSSNEALTSLSILISILFSLNLILFIFNLIPVPPLDGSGVLPLFLSEDRARRYMDFTHHSNFRFFGIFIAWMLFDKIYPPIYFLILKLLF